MLLRSFHYQKHTRFYMMFSNWDTFYLKGYLLNGYTGFLTEVVLILY